MDVSLLNASDAASAMPVTSFQEEPVRIVIPLVEGYTSKDGIECRHWNVQKNIWSASGCNLFVSVRTEERVVCECNHLTEFAVMAKSKQGKTLHYAKYVYGGGAAVLPRVVL